jgi:hypothetical protein
MRRVVRTVSDDDYVEDDELVHRSVARAWSPAQIVAMLVGAFLAILGGVALARTGINFADLDASRAQVAGLEHTPILGLTELIVGLVLVGSAAADSAPRGTMSFFGSLILLFGIITVIEPTAFNRALGTSSGHGWLYAILGAVLVVTAMVAPVVFDSDRRTVVRRGGTVIGHH